MKLIIAMIVLALGSFAHAQSRIVSIDAFDYAYSGGLLMKSDEGKTTDREETTFKLNLNFAQNIEQYVGLMWKAKAYINRQDVNFGSNDLLETRWGAAGGILYNFNADKIKDSIFVGVMAGLERATYKVGSADDQSGFNIFADLEAGKRFDMGQYSAASISYAPTFALSFKRYGGDVRNHYYKSGNEIKINFLKFDILF
jgi:hypothetical protein